MQEEEEQPQSENKDTHRRTFCQICRHPVDVAPGHEPNCPVLTGAPVLGRNWPGVNQQDLQPFPGLDVPLQQHPLNMMQQMAGLVAPAEGPVHGEGPVQMYNRMIRQGNIPIEDGYEVAKIYREARSRILEELKIQVEVNHRLTRELTELRLELQESHEVVKSLSEEINTLRNIPSHIYTDDSPPF